MQTGMPLVKINEILKQTSLLFFFTNIYTRRDFPHRKPEFSKTHFCKSNKKLRQISLS